MYTVHTEFTNGQVINFTEVMKYLYDHDYLKLTMQNGSNAVIPYKNLTFSFATKMNKDNPDTNNIPAMTNRPIPEPTKEESAEAAEPVKEASNG